ncbi:hypothetical protein ABTC48_19985, partial [Acinetobacter baumannii]
DGAGGHGAEQYVVAPLHRQEGRQRLPSVQTAGEQEQLVGAAEGRPLDEAHQLAETASLFFGESVSTSQMLELARDTRAEALVGAKDFKQLPESA